MVFVDIAKIQSIWAFVVAELTFLLFMISEREGVIFSLCIMENFVNAFDHEFDSMNEGVGLFAEAMADAGVECGLPRDKAIEYAAQTLSGAAELMQECMHLDKSLILKLIVIFLLKKSIQSRNLQEKKG